MFVKITLTDEQVKELESLQRQVDEEYENGTPGGIMAQVYPSHLDMSCTFVKYDEIIKMYEVLGLEPPTMEKINE